MCLDFITKDSDGQFIVDYLGKKLYDGGSLLERQKLVTTIEAGYKYALSEWHRFQEANDQKLALRYHLLLSYLESRLPIWGVIVEQRQQIVEIEGKLGKKHQAHL